MNNVQLHHYRNEKQLNEKLSGQLATLLKKAIEERGQAYLAVSGGNSPKGLFQILSKANIPWEKVTITLTDERWVDPTTPMSNEHLVRTYLLRNKGEKANFIPLFYDLDSLGALKLVEEKITLLPSFDAVILGMGNDGHTASLFPCSSEIKEALTTKDAVMFMTPQTASYKRLSLTKSRLLNSKMIFLYLLGDEKLKVLNQALEGDDPFKMPIRAFLQNAQASMHIQFAP